MIENFPKLECPFVRKKYKANKDDFKKFGKKYNLRKPELFLAENEVNPGYEWVFEDPFTLCVEKLDGSNYSIKTENGRIVEIQNRDNVVDPLGILGKHRNHLSAIEGIYKSIAKGYVKDDCIQYGEVIGPKMQGNPLGLNHHIWYPFDKSVSSLQYSYFNIIDPTYEHLSTWFKNDLRSRYYSIINDVSLMDAPFAEGAIFYNLKRKAEGKVYMAKLRRNMFRWYYDEIRIENLSEA